MSAARDLTAALGGGWHGSYGSAVCPAHEDHTPSLSIRNGRDAVLLTCHGGCQHADIIDALKARGLWHGRPRDVRRPVRHHKPEPSPEQCHNRRLAIAIWRECVPIAGTDAETYLRDVRGVTVPLPPTLRFHPRLRYPISGLSFPALVAGVAQVPDHAVIAVQRTFLLPGGHGKAQVSTPKMCLGALDRGALRLAAAGPVLGIAEGIETALSAMQLHGLPVWVSLGVGRMKNVDFPREVERIIIFGDRGEAGERFAKVAGEEFARRGLHVEGRFPPDVSDWNDVLRQERTAA